MKNVHENGKLSGEWVEREVKAVKGLRILRTTVVKPLLAKY